MHELLDAALLYKNEYGRFPRTDQPIHAATKVLNMRIGRMLNGTDVGENPKGIPFLGGKYTSWTQWLFTRFAASKWSEWRKSRPFIRMRFADKGAKAYDRGGIDRREGLILDPWGTPYAFEASAGFLIKSAGPDGVLGNSDDLSFSE
jgi:hypothetical protein